MAALKAPLGNKRAPFSKAALSWQGIGAQLTTTTINRNGLFENLEGCAEHLFCTETMTIVAAEG